MRSGSLYLKRTAKIRLRKKGRGNSSWHCSPHGGGHGRRREISPAFLNPALETTNEHGKSIEREKLKANSPETKTRPKMNWGRGTARDGGNGGR
jgi:hypothetical protein